LEGAPAGARSQVEPLSEERFGVHFTGSARLRAKLEHARNLMSHVSRELEVVIERALDALIRELENKQWGKTDRPRRSRGTKDGSPARKDKREVYERDHAQCAYVSEDGVRCASKAFLQYDHVEPRAFGGSGKADESRLLCQQHNLHHAKRVFGREPVERAIDLRQQKSRAAATGSELDAAAQKRQKLLAALLAQGFKKTESKQVVANVARDATTLSMEELLRRAFALLVPG
jgi:5-methylcytosine-specific restriction endonuclease McrA